MGISIYGFIKIGNTNEQQNEFAHQLRAAVVGGCERQNIVRAGVRELLRDDIRQFKKERHEAKHPDPEILKALHLTEKQTIKLSAKRIHQLNKLIFHKKDRINDLPPAPCNKIYPTL